jgi:hypothetical protein
LPISGASHEEIIRSDSLDDLSSGGEALTLFALIAPALQ